MNVQDFLSYLEVKAGLDKSSLRFYKSKYSVFFSWKGDRPLDKLTIEQFLFHIRGREISPSSYNGYLAFFAQLALYCKSRGIVCDLDHDFKKLKIPKKHIELLSEEEMLQIASVRLPYYKHKGLSKEKTNDLKNLRNSTGIRFLCRTGCRFSEMGELRVSELYLAEKKVVFLDTKSGDDRASYIYDEVLLEGLQRLTANKKPEDYVFTLFGEKRLWGQEFTEDIRKRAKVCGITKPIKNHLFRHSFATPLYEATGNIKLVKEVLGHKKLASSEVYIHMSDEYMKKGQKAHPFNRKFLPPSEKIKALIEELKKHNLQTDSDFDQAKVIEAINTLETLLYKAINAN